MQAPGATPLRPSTRSPREACGQHRMRRRLCGAGWSRVRRVTLTSRPSRTCTAITATHGRHHRRSGWVAKLASARLRLGPPALGQYARCSHRHRGRMRRRYDQMNPAKGRSITECWRWFEVVSSRLAACLWPRARASRSMCRSTRPRPGSAHHRRPSCPCSLPQSVVDGWSQLSPRSDQSRHRQWNSVSFLPTYGATDADARQRCTCPALLPTSALEFNRIAP